MLNVNQRAFFHSHYSVKEKEKKKDMISLYTTLIKQKEFNEKAIKNKFKDKNLGRLVRRLYDIVEDYMLLFDKNNDKYAEIFLFITKAKKQKELGLIDRSEYLLIKAKQIAEEVEDLNYLAIVLKELSSIYIIKNKTEALENLNISKLPQITTELSQYFLLVKMTTKIMQFTLNINGSKIETLYTKEELKLLQTDRKNLNKECYEIQLYLNSTYYAFCGKFEKSYEFQLKSLQFYESLEKITSFNFTRYNLQLYNTFRSQIKFEKYEEAKGTLIKLTSLEHTSDYFTNDRLTAIYKFRKANCELIYNNKVKNFEAIIKSKKEYEQTIKLFEQFVSRSQVFTVKFFIGFAFYAQKNYNSASDYFKYLLDDKAIKQRADIEDVAHMLYLICIYEIDKGNFAKSVLEATTRFLKNKSRAVYKSDDLVIELIAKLLKPLQDSKTKVKLKTEYIAQITSISNLNKIEKERIRELGLLNWLK